MEVELIVSKEWHNTRTGRSGGNSHGYSTAAASMGKALTAVGVKLKAGAKIALHYTSAPFYEPEPGRVNVLYTMWEAEDLPPTVRDPLKDAPYVVVPSKNSKDVIKKAGLTCTVYICHQAVDTDFYTFKDRGWKEGDRVRYIWVGAPNIRKGFDIAVKAFHKAFHGSDVNVEFYLKSSFFKREGEITELPQHRAVIDTRNLSREGLRDLYWSANVFFFPSRGEGAGLTPMEAMSTGLPVIAPPYTGMKDYVLPAHSYPVSFVLSMAHYGLDTKLCEADMGELVDRLRHVYFNMPEAIKKGEKASVFIRRNFTLEIMGRRMLDILNKIVKREGL